MSTSSARSLHDMERDRIALNWDTLPEFSCAVCETSKPFLSLVTIRTEVRFSGRLRADVAALDISGRVIGVVEVVRSHPPSELVLSEQEKLEFAYYRFLTPPGRKEPESWLCSPDCWRMYTQLAGDAASSPWEPARCDGCESYFHQNKLSWMEFHDWDSDPNSAYCIFCAAKFDQAQWRAPGDIAFDDPREWTPDDDSDPAVLFLAYWDTKFWDMVWSSRVAKLDEPDLRLWSENIEAEDATARRLVQVNAAFDKEEWKEGNDLLIPIASPGWQYIPGETERMLAFRPENTRGVALAWNRLLQYRFAELPQVLQDTIVRGPT